MYVKQHHLLNGSYCTYGGAQYFAVIAHKLYTNSLHSIAPKVLALVGMKCGPCSLPHDNSHNL